jgi:hypothetical protein
VETVPWHVNVRDCQVDDSVLALLKDAAKDNAALVAAGPVAVSSVSALKGACGLSPREVAAMQVGGWRVVLCVSVCVARGVEGWWDRWTASEWVADVCIKTGV